MSIFEKPIRADEIMVNVEFSLHDCHCLGDILHSTTLLMGMDVAIQREYTEGFAQWAQGILEKIIEAVKKLDISEERKEKALRYALGEHL